MDVIPYNFLWMTHNVLLALIPVYLAILIALNKNTYFRVVLGALWLFFVPNTIYVLTDLKHVPVQLMTASTSEMPIILLQYVVLETVGILSFIVAVYLIEKVVYAHSKKRVPITRMQFVLLLNFLIAYGVTMGRFLRTNSWEMVTNIHRVFADMTRVLTTPNLLLFFIIFGIVINGIYFLFHNLATRIVE